MKRTKSERTATRQSLSRHSTKYDVVPELADAKNNLTFGKLAFGDGENAKTDIKRDLSRGVNAPPRAIAAMVTLRTRSRRVEIVPIKEYGSDTEALLNCEAVFNLVYENLFNDMELEAKRRLVGFTRANWQQACQAGRVGEGLISFHHLQTSTDFYVTENTFLKL